MSNTPLKKPKKKAPKKSTRSSKTSSSNLEYSVKTRKRGRGYTFLVVENKDRTVATFKFREEAQKVADFQNKNQVWKVNGGIPKFLLD
jgi:hypothetical protein